MQTIIGTHTSTATLRRSKPQTHSARAISSKPTVQTAIAKHSVTTATSSRILSGNSASTSTSSSMLRRRQDSQKLEAATLVLSHEAQAKTGDNFCNLDEYLSSSDVPVLVDFYAPWCGPCELMGRVVSEISKELKGNLRVVKINTDNYPKLASKYRVQALPTCLLFRDGILIDRVDGFMPEPNFGKRVRFYVARLDKKFGRR